MLLRWTGLPDVRVIRDVGRLPESAELAEDMRERAERCLRRLDQIAKEYGKAQFGWDAPSAARLDWVCGGILLGRPDAGTTERAAADIGSYLGEVIVRNSISCWVYDAEAQGAAVETMWGRRLFPHSRVGKRLAHGRPNDDLDALLAEASTHSLRAFYETAVTGRMPPDAKIIPRDFP